MFCPKCGQPIDAGKAFCRNCGAAAPETAESVAEESSALAATEVRPPASVPTDLSATSPDIAGPPPVVPLPPPVGFSAVPLPPPTSPRISSSPPAPPAPGYGPAWQPPQGPPGGRRRTGLIIGIVAAVIVVLAGAGVGSYLLLQGDDTAKTTTTLVGSSSTTLAATMTSARPTTTTVIGGTTTQTTILTAADMIEKAQRSVVLIDTGLGTGSGFLIESGLVMTAAHVVEGSSTVQVKFANGRKVVGTVVRLKPDVDLALVSVSEPNLPLLQLFQGDLRAGSECYAIGSPLGFEQSVSKGIVSNPSRYAESVRLVQIDAPVNPGNSGGPIVDQSGRVIATVVLKFEQSEGMGFGVAYTEVAQFLAEAASGKWAATDANATSTTSTTTAQSTEDYLTATDNLVLLLLDDDTRIPGLATQINNTAPKVPQWVLDELQSMMGELDSAYTSLGEVVVPAEFEGSNSWLLEAGTAMGNRIYATIQGIEAMRNANSVGAGTKYFDQGRQSRDEFRADFAKFHEAVPID